MCGRSNDNTSLMHATVLMKRLSLFSAMWTAAIAVMIGLFQSVAWVRTAGWPPVTILDALGLAGVPPVLRYSPASLVETENGGPSESLIFWLLEMPLILLLLIVAVLLYWFSIWITSYENRLRGG